MNIKVKSDKLVSHDQFKTRLRAVLISKFIECHRRMFESTIRKGNWVGLSPTDLRQLVRSFAMGWAESAAARGDTVYCHSWAMVFGEITMPDWWPGPEWRFW